MSWKEKININILSHIMIEQYELILPRYNRGYHLITSQIEKKIPFLPENDIINLFIQHTSPGLKINDNADPSVRTDFEQIMNHIIPEGMTYYTHTIEGNDDIPAHIKSSLIGCSLTIPIRNHKLSLGTWQGIYLCEFRNSGGNRKILITLYY